MEFLGGSRSGWVTNRCSDYGSPSTPFFQDKRRLKGVRMKLTYRNDQLTPSISHRGKTRNLNRLLLPVWLMATLGVFSTPAFPQDLASLDRAYHPGEPIHV